MRHFLWIILAVSGCAPYIEVQSQLVEQTRRGVSQLGTSLEQKSQFVAQHQAAQRRRIDEAFDQDVRTRASLSPDWVIEHRRAYAAALDALASAHTASIESDNVDHRNLAAIREALDRLQFLQSLQLRLLSFQTRDEHEQD